MTRTFSTGATGLHAYQGKMDVIANNLANVDTTAYKAVSSTFSDLLYSEMYVSNPDVPAGAGVKIMYSGINTTQGDPVATGVDTDFAIVGDAWFAVKNGNETLYTRNGAFHISMESSTAYLVDQNGYYVLDASGNKITLSAKTTSSNSSTGTSTAKSTNSLDLSTLNSKIGLYTFSNPQALTPLSSNCYAANDLTGKATAAANGQNQLLSGYLEQSSVSMLDGMAELIMAQRGYQISARVVQTADEIEQTINSLRS